MALYGNIGIFNEKDELFADYADRCDAFIAANDIPADKCVHFFLAVVGPHAYRLLKDLSSPNLPSSKKYSEVKKLLQDHFSPKPIVIAERHRFWTAMQGENESISCFIVRLKNISTHCNFGSFLEEALRDRLVSGLHVRMSKTQTSLLAMADLKFDQAKNKCLADEMASAATKDYLSRSSYSSNADTNAVYRGRNNHSENRQYQNKCKGCGGNHKRADCHFKDSVCHKCQKKGHIQRVCRGSGTGPRPGSRTDRKPFKGSSSTPNPSNWKQANTKHVVEEDVYLDSVQEEPPSYESENTFGLYNIKDTNISHVSPYIIHMSIGKGKTDNVSMEVDTGATRSTISEYVYRSELSNSYPLKKCNFTLRSYTGDLIPTIGYVSVPMKYKDNPSHVVDIIVVKGRRPALLGRDLLSQIKLDWVKLFNVNVGPGSKAKMGKIDSNIPKTKASDPPSFHRLLEKHTQLFSDEDSGIKGFSAKPVYQKSRPVPYAMVEKVEKEYERLIKSEIVSPLNHSDWASPTVHVIKPNGSVRVCGDYKQINSRIEDDGYNLPSVQDLLAKLAQEGAQPKVYSVIDLAGAFNQLF